MTLPAQVHPTEDCAYLHIPQTLLEEVDLAPNFSSPRSSPTLLRQLLPLILVTVGLPPLIDMNAAAAPGHWMPWAEDPRRQVTSTGEEAEGRRE